MSGLSREMAEQRLRVCGHVASLEARLATLRSMLDAAPDWQPGVALRAQCDELGRQLAVLPEQLASKLVVTILGPSGVGKSSLLNALAQAPVSVVGHKRPTTRDVLVFASSVTDIEPLAEAVGREQVKLVSSAAAAKLENVVVVDTPDFNSDARAAHRPLIERVLQRTDVLLVVLNGTTLKDHAHAQYLYPLLQRFPQEAVYVVVNQIDAENATVAEIRHALDALRRDLATLWPGCRVKEVLSTIATDHLDPAKSGHAPQELDQFERLRQLVFDSPGSLLVDLRCSRVDHLFQFLQRRIALALDTHNRLLQDQRQALLRADEAALETAVRSMSHAIPTTLGELDSLAYTLLARRSIGPVGWLISVWTRLVLLSGARWRLWQWLTPRLEQSARGSDPASADGALNAPLAPPPQALQAIQVYQRQLTESFVQIADQLVRDGFYPYIRELKTEDPAHTYRRLVSLWQRGGEQAARQAVRRLSSFWCQLLINLPLLAVAGLASQRMVMDLVSGSQYPSAAVSPLVWLLGFLCLLSMTLVQFVMHFLTGPRLLDATVRQVLHELRSGHAAERPLLRVIDQLQALKDLQTASAAGAALPP